MEHIDIPPGEIHAPHNWEFADAVTREAAEITDATLVNKWALQLDDGTYWRLAAIGTPATWALVGATKASLGLDQVDNTADADKPVSTPQQQAIDAAFGSVTKSSLGLGNVNNTADADKPVSTAQATAIAAKFDKSGGALTGGLREKAVALAAFNIDLALGNYFTKTLTAGGTFTVSNPPAAGEVAAFILDITGGNTGVVAYPAGTTWGTGEVAPTLTAGRDVLGFIRNGTGGWTGKVISLGAAG